MQRSEQATKKLSNSTISHLHHKSIYWQRSLDEPNSNERNLYEKWPQQILDSNFAEKMIKFPFLEFLQQGYKHIINT